MNYFFTLGEKIHRMWQQIFHIDALTQVLRLNFISYVPSTIDIPLCVTELWQYWTEMFYMVMVLQLRSMILQHLIN